MAPEGPIEWRDGWYWVRYFDANEGCWRRYARAQTREVAEAINIKAYEQGFPFEWDEGEAS